MKSCAQGYSLIEVLVALCLFSIASLGLEVVLLRSQVMLQESHGIFRAAIELHNASEVQTLRGVIGCH